tara:strand:+ start:1351 stop:1542 length:192 start_codon:yes stop_codon:yes gene_type:complete
VQISDGTKICIHIDYEMGVEEGLGHQAIVRNLTKTWSMKPNEIEAIIKEQEEFLSGNSKGVIV